MLKTKHDPKEDESYKQRLSMSKQPNLHPKIKRKMDFDRAIRKMSHMQTSDSESEAKSQNEINQNIIPNPKIEHKNEIKMRRKTRKFIVPYYNEEYNDCHENNSVVFSDILAKSRSSLIHHELSNHDMNRRTKHHINKQRKNTLSKSPKKFRKGYRLDLR